MYRAAPECNIMEHSLLWGALDMWTTGDVQVRGRVLAGYCQSVTGFVKMCQCWIICRDRKKKRGVKDHSDFFGCYLNIEDCCSNYTRSEGRATERARLSVGSVAAYPLFGRRLMPILSMGGGLTRRRGNSTTLLFTQKHTFLSLVSTSVQSEYVAPWPGL